MKRGEGFSELVKIFYRKGNSVKRSRPFSEPPGSEDVKVAVLIPFPKISSWEPQVRRKGGAGGVWGRPRHNSPEFVPPPWIGGRERERERERENKKKKQNKQKNRKRKKGRNEV